MSVCDRYSGSFASESLVDRQRQREAEAARQHAVEVDRADDVDVPLRQERRLLAELAELRIAIADVDVQVAEIGGVHAEAHLARHAARVHRARESNVVDPELERVGGQDGRRAAGLRRAG